MDILYIWSHQELSSVEGDICLLILYPMLLLIDFFHMIDFMFKGKTKLSLEKIGLQKPGQSKMAAEKRRIVTLTCHLAVAQVWVF